MISSHPPPEMYQKSQCLLLTFLLTPPPISMHFHTNNRIAAGSHARVYTQIPTFGNSGNALLCIDIAVCAEDAVLIRCSSMLPAPGGMRYVKNLLWAAEIRNMRWLQLCAPCISEAKREQPERMLKHTLNRLPSLSWHVCLCRPALSQRCKKQEGKSTPAFDCLVLGLVRAKFSAVCALTVSEWCILLSL